MYKYMVLIFIASAKIQADELSQEHDEYSNDAAFIERVVEFEHRESYELEHNEYIKDFEALHKEEILHNIIRDFEVMQDTKE